MRMPAWLFTLLAAAFVLYTDDYVIAGILPELAADLGVAAPGITAQFVDDVDGVTAISPANPTHQLAISVDGSVPDGVYPLEIAGYSGEHRETLTIRVVVGAASALTEKIYLPVVLR